MIFTVGYYHILFAFSPLFFSLFILVYAFCELQTLIFERVNFLIEIYARFWGLVVFLSCVLILTLCRCLCSQITKLKRPFFLLLGWHFVYRLSTLKWIEAKHRLWKTIKQLNAEDFRNIMTTFGIANMEASWVVIMNFSCIENGVFIVCANRW